MAVGRLQPLVQLPYTIHDFSSYSGEFSPGLILLDRPFDQKSRWLSDGNKPPQFLILRVSKPAIVSKILFGKYEKSHPCNIQKLKVYGGLDPEHTHLLLESGLKNDDVAEMLDLHYSIDGQPFPCQYIKIVPQQSWGGSFNFSIWHIQLWGISEDSQVEDALAKLMQFKEREAVRLCLKHLRQHDYLEAFEALQKKSKVLLEDPILTQLHHQLVTIGKFEEAERTICKAVDDGFFDSYISKQLIQARWTCIPCALESDLGTQGPDMRGGHHMCICDSGHLYLCGGWDGTKELADLWQFTIKTEKWACLSFDTSQEGGPGPRSCHAMCYSSGQRALYLLGGYVESTSVSGQQDSPPCGFYMYLIDSNKWHLLSADTSKEGGPRMIYDHQMCCDRDSGLLYVSGGRIVGTQLCSGLYAYHTVEQHWLCLFPDQSQLEFSVKPPYFPRSGHIMLYHPVLHQLFVIGGHRQQEILSDMLTYHVRSGETSVLFDGKDTAIPVTDMILRAAMDFHNNCICLSGLGSLEELDSNSLWIYDISSTRWSRVNKDEKILQYKCPVARYAHSFVYDSQHQCYYMFGGNSSNGNVHAKNTSSMRLDDLWKMQLVRQSKDSLLKECQFSLRKQKYIELSALSPVEAVAYLQTSVATLVDHDNQNDSKQYRELTSVLFNCGAGVDWPKKTTSIQKMRTDLYDRIASYFPHNMAQPRDNLLDFITLKK